LRTIALTFLILSLSGPVRSSELMNAQNGFFDRDFRTTCDCLSGLELNPGSRRLLLLSCLRAGLYETITEALIDIDLGELKDDELVGYVFAEHEVPGDNELELSLLDTLIDRVPYFADWALALKVDVYLGMHQLTEAESALKALLEGHPRSIYAEEPLLDYAGALFQSGRVDSTIRTLKRWSRVLGGDESASAIHLLGKAYMEKGDTLGRNREYKRLLLDFTDTPDAFQVIDSVPGLEYEKGKALYRQRRYEEAARYFLRAQGKGDADRAAPYRLLSLYRSGRYIDLLDEFREVKERLHGELKQSIYFYCAVACTRLGRTADAAEFLFRLIEMGDVYRGAYELTYLLLSQRDLHWGKRTFRTAKERLEGCRDPLLRFRFGLLDLVHHDEESAVLEFQGAAKDTGFTRAQALFWLGKVTGEQAYADTLASEFPLSYYTFKMGIDLDLETTPIEEWVVGFSGDSLESMSDDVRRWHIEAFLGNERQAYRKVTAEPFDWLSGARYFRSLGLDWGTLELADNLRRHAEARGETLPRALLDLWFPKTYLPLITRITHHLDLDPLIFLALVREESHFDPKAGSWAGALGLAQLMPFTGRAVAKRFSVELERDHFFIPKVNLLLGATYFKDMIDEFGEYYLALAAYNAGPHRVRRWLGELGDLDEDLFIEFIPFRETRNYVRRVLRGYNLYKVLDSEKG
jgi:tetratricopeptide (TPR) repeat protein